MIHLGIYQHYKGKYYQVIGLARHSETLEELVVYQALYGGCDLLVRLSKMFGEEVLIDNQFAIKNLCFLITLLTLVFCRARKFLQSGLHPGKISSII